MCAVCGVYMWCCVVVWVVCGCVVLCVVLVLCVCTCGVVVRVVWWCVCVVCGEAWHAGKSPVCRFKTPPCVRSGRLRVYRQKARMC